MTDETTQAPTTEPTQTIPYERFKEVNDKARQAAKELEQAKQRLAQYEAEQQALAERKALEQGEHEKVIASLKPKAERADQLEAAILSQLETRLSALPEDKRATVLQIVDLVPTPEGKLAALENLSPFVTTSNRATPAPMNGGQGQKPTGASPSQDDLYWARLTNVPIDEYMKHKRG